MACCSPGRRSSPRTISLPTCHLKRALCAPQLLAPLAAWCHTATAPLIRAFSLLSTTLWQLLAPLIALARAFGTQLGAVASVLLGPPARALLSLGRLLLSAGSAVAQLGQALAAGPLYVLSQMQGSLAAGVGMLAGQLAGVAAVAGAAWQSVASGFKVGVVGEGSLAAACRCMQPAQEHMNSCASNEDSSAAYLKPCCEE